MSVRDLTTMADPPGGDPGGDPTNSQRMVTLSPPQGSSPPSEFRRITRGYKRRRNSLTSVTGTNEAPGFDFTDRSEENSTNLGEVTGLIADLKKIVIQQSNFIENVKADLTETKSEQESLKNENAELQNKIRSVRTQLSTYSVSVPSPGSWASVAASGATAGTETSLSGSTSTNNQNKEPNCVRIST